MEEENISNIWFQQDGATCQTAEITVDVLRLGDHYRAILNQFVFTKIEEEDIGNI